MESSTRWITAGAGLSTGLAAAFALKAARRPRELPLEAVPFVDLARYAGRWFEIARYPSRFERACAKNTVAEYTLRKNGTLRVANACTRHDGSFETVYGRAVVADSNTSAKLKVRFAPFAPRRDYWIVDLADDYSYAIVGEPKRRYVWMLSRTPAMDDHLFMVLCTRLARTGYDPSKLLRTLQD